MLVSIEVVVLAAVTYLFIPRIEAISRTIVELDWWVVPIAVCLEAASLAFYGELDLCTLRGIGVEAKRSLVHRVNLVGTALGKVLPGGGTAALPFTARMLETEGAEPVLAIAALTAAGLLASLVLALLLPLAVLIAMIGGNSGVLASSVLGVAAVIGALALLVRPALSDPDRIEVIAERAASAVARGPIRRFVHPRQFGASVGNATAALLHLTTSRAMLARAGAYSAASWLLDFAALVAIALSIGHGSALTGLPLAYVVGQLAALVPLTPGGVGVVEASMTAALVAQGSTVVAATVTVLAWRLASHWLPVAVGLAVYVMRPRRRIGHTP